MTLWRDSSEHPFSRFYPCQQIWRLTAVHILTGILPAEAITHKRVLALFGSICRLSDDSVEKQIERRQLSIKSYSSHSWFVVIKELLIKYDLDSPFYLMDAKLSKSQWIVRVAKAVNSYWTRRLASEATLYSTPKKMNSTMLIPGK